MMIAPIKIVDLNFKKNSVLISKLSISEQRQIHGGGGGVTYGTKQTAMTENQAWTNYSNGTLDLKTDDKAGGRILFVPPGVKHPQAKYTIYTNPPEGFLD
jgi:hypothetical protein